MTDIAGTVLTKRKSAADRRFFVALFLTGLLLADAFWFKPLLTIGVDPQKERCLPDLHAALMVHRAPREVRDGDLVFWKPQGALSHFREQYIMKEVAGVPGDLVTVAGGKVMINGHTVVEGFPLARYYHKPANAFDRSEIIPAGKLFMIGTHPLSNDSRYWGYLDVTRVSGFAYRLF
ncbi:MULTISPECIES: signal peptidase I [Paraburkholderia]|uniref:Signal peptidase I n=1 Tax=Paraburkholderia madseniana TaxID=2599607 RepID=A0AAP5BN02_9BURK|nr:MULTISPECIES: signal peptidase I [Paraburkholderia]MCX4151030.1 signal peptidase I [Paraburkholderia madseniana]MCX4176670.1 signal peptidase I [Paraburkholderia madseniana]MDN7153962.1 signal peptidase I [Paraburkholderia sp. WS6]MDQ6412844.1 signal peptidase I [Paraburkholderia madseniana]MDQ6464661.1 signal peptidase I [Paraburkholderia madseniana]